MDIVSPSIFRISRPDSILSLKLFSNDLYYDYLQQTLIPYVTAQNVSVLNLRRNQLKQTYLKGDYI